MLQEPIALSAKWLVVYAASSRHAHLTLMQPDDKIVGIVSSCKDYTERTDQ